MEAIAAVKTTVQEVMIMENLMFTLQVALMVTPTVMSPMVMVMVMNPMVTVMNPMATTMNHMVIAMNPMATATNLMDILMNLMVTAMNPMVTMQLTENLITNNIKISPTWIIRAILTTLQAHLTAMDMAMDMVMDITIVRNMITALVIKPTATMHMTMVMIRTVSMRRLPSATTALRAKYMTT